MVKIIQSKSLTCKSMQKLSKKASNRICEKTSINDSSKRMIHLSYKRCSNFWSAILSSLRKRSIYVRWLYSMRTKKLSSFLSKDMRFKHHLKVKLSFRSAWIMITLTCLMSVLLIWSIARTFISTKTLSPKSYPQSPLPVLRSFYARTSY
jgi:hypothetical protein